MPILTASEVEALMATGLDEPTLTDVIDREAKWLASRIGPLEGEVTETIRPIDDGPLYFRPSTITEVKLDGTVVATSAWTTVTDSGSTRLHRASGTLWLRGAVTVKRTLLDGLEVKRVLIELVRLMVSATPYQQESTEGHSYARGRPTEVSREALARSLKPKIGPTSIRVR